MNQVMKFLRDEEGASAVEYGLIIGLIAVAIIVVLGFLGNGLENLFNKANDGLTNAQK
ncbi:Flp family type IVb pilin [Solimonas fluminis]|jgi:pilus assembly protein Flp/PilA|uniref:Flp family type IVb pilin n=1 Tax=Solimonas fluminis TaxID=2086571 RepID=A0A2S5TIA1_9GAMM|nr:Flp family type IVb pilin [Solimonas fluminis]PPE74714.1 Flp family type IVb pilin [Solimonas fluminis]